MTASTSSHFYTGLVVELYEPLAGDLASSEPIKRFVLRYGTPALELACGAGHPMLDLLADKLEVLRKASDRGLDTPTVACQLMQDLSLKHRYPCCYLAGASFCPIENLTAYRGRYKNCRTPYQPERR